MPLLLTLMVASSVSHECRQTLPHGNRELCACAGAWMCGVERCIRDRKVSNVVSVSRTLINIIVNIMCNTRTRTESFRGMTCVFCVCFTRIRECLSAKDKQPTSQPDSHARALLGLSAHSFEHMAKSVWSIAAIQSAWFFVCLARLEKHPSQRKRANGVGCNKYNYALTPTRLLVLISMRHASGAWGVWLMHTHTSLTTRHNHVFSSS